MSENATKHDEHKDFVKTLAFFKGLSDDVFNALMQSANIREYNKGKVLFLEGEQSIRFYIILKGWVKLFKGTASGEEAVLQMLGEGDAIVESAVFLNTPYPVSAQVAEDAILLSFPGPMIREQIRANNQLAVNMLNTISQKSQLLIQQIEFTRLKSAKERVGWYLLKLLVDNGRYEDAIELPYDKSMIASYLDMKPETFSRTLKKFKEQGFRIENDMIILPEVSALCGYCDLSTAASCPIHGTEECPNPQD